METLWSLSQSRNWRSCSFEVILTLKSWWTYHNFITGMKTPIIPLLLTLVKFSIVCLSKFLLITVVAEKPVFLSRRLFRKTCLRKSPHHSFVPWKLGTQATPIHVAFQRNSIIEWWLAKVHKWASAYICLEKDSKFDPYNFFLYLWTSNRHSQDVGFFRKKKHKKITCKTNGRPTVCILGSLSLCMSWSTPSPFSMLKDDKKSATRECLKCGESVSRWHIWKINNSHYL